MSTRHHQAASDSYLELLKEAALRDLNLSDEDGMTSYTPISLPRELGSPRNNLQQRVSSTQWF